jgi:L-aminopeptidase/D-esterase-like protein
MARTGSLGGNGSGDIFLAFSTANPKAAHGDEKGLAPLQSLSNNFIDPLLVASAYATEEAIINSMITNMTGHNGLAKRCMRSYGYYEDTTECSGGYRYIHKVALVN